MRIRTFLFATAAVLAVGSFTMSLPAAAQSNPSAEDMIKLLKPSGSMKGGTRGIRPAAPAAPDAVQPAAAKMPAPSAGTAAPMQHAAAQAPAPAAAPSLNLTVQFRSGSAELTPEAVKTLSALGKALSSPDLASYKFRIEGHTDTVGSREANMALSKERAEKVADFLEKNFGVGANRIEAVGRGEEAPLIPTPDQTNEPRNRRVQVVNLGA